MIQHMPLPNHLKVTGKMESFVIFENPGAYAVPGRYPQFSAT